MGACADMWQEEVEKVGQDFAFGRITRDEAMQAMRRLGFDANEAKDMLDEAVA
jgi:tellurite resistance protein